MAFLPRGRCSSFCCKHLSKGLLRGLSLSQGGRWWVWVLSLTFFLGGRQEVF